MFLRVLIWCVFWAGCCAALADRRNRGVVAWVVLGLLFGPFALILLACMRTLPESGVLTWKRKYRRVIYDPETRRLMDSSEVRAWQTREAEAQAKMDAKALEAEPDAKMRQPPP